MSLLISPFTDPDRTKKKSFSDNYDKKNSDMSDSVGDEELMTEEELITEERLVTEGKFETEEEIKTEDLEGLE